MRKPSKAAVRVLTILAYIEGTITLVESEHGDPIIDSRITYTRQQCSIATDAWEVIGDRKELGHALAKVMLGVNDKLKQIWWLDAKPNMNYPGLCYISMHLLDDLMPLIKSQGKTLMLQNIYDALTLLIDYVDPEGEMFLTQERADTITNCIYDVVGYP